MYNINKGGVHLKKIIIMLTLVLVFITGCSKQDAMKVMQEDIQKNGIESAHVQKRIGAVITERDVMDKDIPTLQEALSEFEVEEIPKRKMELLYGSVTELKLKLKNGTNYEITEIGNTYLIVNDKNYIIKNDSYETFSTWVDSVFNLTF